MEKIAMQKLSFLNVDSDQGEISKCALESVEKRFNIMLPEEYISFITKHNAAYLKTDVFDFIDPNLCGRKSSDSFFFANAEKICYKIGLLQADNHEWPLEYQFEDGLIPFGDNGGGDKICFDYRNNKITSDPQVVLWMHDMGFEHRVVFLANNFEEFINMLHEPKEDE
jgi:hypothetical protein